MNPSESPATQPNLQPLAILARSFKTPGRIARFIVSLIIAAFIFCVSSDPHALAKPAHQASSQGNPDIDPNAMEALNRMGTYLRSLKAFKVDSEVTQDDVLDDGEIITTIRTNTLLAVKPDLLRAELKSEDRDVLLFYDGKNLTVYGKLVNYYATVPAPATTAQLVDKAYNQYGIEVPLIDLFKWGTDESAIRKITSASDVGPSTLQGITCEHYAFRQQGLDWQIWIQLGDYPLPLKFIIRTLTDDARPQHTANLVWDLAPSYNQAAFVFYPPAGALRIALKDISSKPTRRNQ